MSKALSYACAALCVFSFTALTADDEFSSASAATPQMESSTPAAPVAGPVLSAKPAPEVPFRPFTGKVKGRKVRLRVNADLESQVLRELTKNDVISVVGEKADFWAIEAPAGTKAYVFRSFILDNVVEGNRVNVRLKPDLESPIIGHLNAGEKINGTVSSLNNKWLEIAAPSTTRFYIAKEFIENIGGPEVKVQMDKRRATVEQLLDATSLLSKAEMRKPYEEIDIERFVHNYNTIIHDYVEFTDQVEHAKEALTALQEEYVQKKIAFLETKSSSSNSGLFAMGKNKGEEKAAVARPVEDPTDRMKLWEPIEEALYLTWAHLNDDRNIDEYYAEQKANAVAVTGILEVYNAPVKNKPGDYILRDKDLPVAYLYSTKVNLHSMIGKRVSVLGMQRPNNNFAFPAYFVLAAE